MKYFVKNLLLAVFILAAPIGVFAAQDDGIYTYVFHLYFDNGALVKDRDYEVPFELVAQVYESGEGSVGFYYGEILSVSNQKLATFPVPVPGSGSGKILPIAPYFDNAKTANFYNSQNQRLLTIDLAPSGPVCNENKQCNADTGETYLNCPSDCSAPTPSPAVQFPDQVVGFSTYINDILRSPVFIIVLVAIIAGIIVWLWWRRKKKILPPTGGPEIPMPPPPQI